MASCNAPRMLLTALRSSIRPSIRPCTASRALQALASAYRGHASPANPRNRSQTAISRVQVVRQPDDFMVVERCTRYSFKDHDYLALALYNRSSPASNLILPQGQQHLAIIGDALIKLIYFTENFPGIGHRDGVIKNFSAFESNSNLHRIGVEAGLDRFFSGLKTVHDCGTVVEAIWGAVYLDSGHNVDAVKGAIDCMLSARGNSLTSKRSIISNPKSGAEEREAIRITEVLERRGLTRRGWRKRQLDVKVANSQDDNTPSPWYKKMALYL